MIAPSPEALPGETDRTRIERLLVAAAGASRPWGDAPPSSRAKALRAAAEALDESRGQLVRLADEETHLGEQRLNSELSRTTFQLRFFAEVLDEGAYVGATIDHQKEAGPIGPTPDLRRLLHPLGPVVVFAASNFPFAFSTAGGDTASALGAGCPVLLKVHPGHPRLAVATGKVLSNALSSAGAPDGTFAIFLGDEAGRTIITDPRIAAGTFTGSIAGGRALFDLASSRPIPIPFYAELGSVNPVFVTEEALRNHRGEILKGYLASFTQGVGQFCTKPGLLIVPEGAGAVEELTGMVSAMASARLLNDRIAGRYARVLKDLSAIEEMTVAYRGGGIPSAPEPTLLTSSTSAMILNHEKLLQECFGPASIVVTYAERAEMLDLAEVLDGQLTATIWAEGDEEGLSELCQILRDRVGRLIFNGWPTGVAVTWATQHGGPYPAATSSLYTSVGASAINRFLRPIAYQSFPDTLLPAALRESNPLGLPRRVDGLSQFGTARLK